MHPRDLFDSEGLRWQFFVLKYTFSFSAPIKDEMDIWHQEICHLDLCKLQFQMSTQLLLTRIVLSWAILKKLVRH